MLEIPMARLLLWGAASYGHTEIIKELIAAGADVNVKNNDGETALMSAAIGGRTEVVKILIIAKADVNAQDNKGETALIEAAYCGHTEVVKMLLRAGAKHGKTALDCIRTLGNKEIIELLKKVKKK